MIHEARAVFCTGRNPVFHTYQYPNSMKKICLLILILLVVHSPQFAQCGSATCPPGAINTLPANGIIAAGTTYCISGTISNTSAYTVNGTLIIQSGSVTVGNLIVSKTGSIIVMGGARLMANAYTGEATAPVSSISNMTVCTNGYLYLSGAINPGKTNFTVNDYGIFVIHGSWSTIVSDTYFKIGMGAIIEMCSSFSFISSTGFFTETSSNPSYIVTRSAVANGAGTGYLSKSGAASQILWAIPGGPVAWVTHPSANTCNGSSCSPTTIPPGATDNGLCGSVANSFQMTLLSRRNIDVKKQLYREKLLITAYPGDGYPKASFVLEGSPDGAHFTPTAYAAVAGPGNSYQFSLPAGAAGNFYRVQVTGIGGSFYSKILSPSENVSPNGYGQVKVFPNPATNFLYISISPDEKFTSAAVISSLGQVLKEIPLVAGTTITRCELPPAMPAGTYFVRLNGKGRTSRTVRMIKTD